LGKNRLEPEQGRIGRTAHVRRPIPGRFCLIRTHLSSGLARFFPPFRPLPGQGVAVDRSAQGCPGTQPLQFDGNVLILIPESCRRVAKSVAYLGNRGQAGSPNVLMAVAALANRMRFTSQPYPNKLSTAALDKRGGVRERMIRNCNHLSQDRGRSHQARTTYRAGARHCGS
jgi:hypothetical protein